MCKNLILNTLEIKNLVFVLWVWVARKAGEGETFLLQPSTRNSEIEGVVDQKSNA
ncbi:hypothetical protein Hanom_Chr17g01553921 [Helianthus anomalus]